MRAAGRRAHPWSSRASWGSASPVRARGESRGGGRRDRRAAFRPRRASFGRSHSFPSSSKQLPSRQIEHDFLAAAADRVDADLAVDALNLATGDIGRAAEDLRSEEHTSELQSLMRISYAVFCLTNKNY